MELTQIHGHEKVEKIAQNARKNSLTIAENDYENVFEGCFCKETIKQLTFMQKNAGFLAKNSPFKGVFISRINPERIN